MVSSASNPPKAPWLLRYRLIGCLCLRRKEESPNPARAARNTLDIPHLHGPATRSRPRQPASSHPGFLTGLGAVLLRFGPSPSRRGGCGTIPYRVPVHPLAGNGRARSRSKCSIKATIGPHLQRNSRLALGLGEEDLELINGIWRISSMKHLVAIRADRS